MDTKKAVIRLSHLACDKKEREIWCLLACPRTVYRWHVTEGGRGRAWCNKETYHATCRKQRPAVQATKMITHSGLCRLIARKLEWNKITMLISWI